MQVVLAHTCWQIPAIHQAERCTRYRVVRVAQAERTTVMIPWRWRIAALLALLCAADVAGARKSAGGGGDPMDFLSGVSGTYTHLVDDDLSVTISYDLQDDSSVPFSFVTG